MLNIFFNQIKCIFSEVERNLVNLNEPFRFGFEGITHTKRNIQISLGFELVNQGMCACVSIYIFLNLPTKQIIAHLKQFAMFILGKSLHTFCCCDLQFE